MGYEKASGRLGNSCNTSQEAWDCFLHLSGVPSTQRYDKYLALPTLVGKFRMSEFNSIKDRIWKRLHDWKTKFLCQASKEILLKAMI